MTSVASDPERLRPHPRTGRIGLTAASRRVVLDALARIEGGSLELTLPDGSTRTLGDGQGPAFRATVNSDDLWRRLARRGRTGLGEAYVAGDWDTDDLPGMLGLLLRNARAAVEREPLATIAKLGRLRPHLPGRRTIHRARRDIQYHYDLGNDLFRLFLDESMTYSCAYYEHPGQSLADAQQAKYRRLCEKLALGPDDHVLEIGCGWGAFALHAATERGCRVTGLTISEQQHALARERVAAAGLQDRIEILFRDYRTMEGSFSKIVSIEMFEAIGYSQFETFFRTADRLLAPGGSIGLQTIAIPDRRFDRYRKRPDWIQQYIFPGSLMPSVTAMAKAMTKASTLHVHGLEEIGLHYADTLREWRERFDARLEEALALGYDERFARIWRYYLASCEALFRTRSMRDVQLVLTRQYNESLPAFPSQRPSH